MFLQASGDNMLSVRLPQVPDTNEVLPAGCNRHVESGGELKTCIYRKPMLAMWRWGLEHPTEDQGVYSSERSLDALRGEGQATWFQGRRPKSWGLVISQG